MYINILTLYLLLFLPRSAIYANRHYLDLYSKIHRFWLAQNSPHCPTISGNVFIHPTAVVHETAYVS